MNQPIQVVTRGTPWLLIATVALLIAKFGFGVQISLLWAFAPLWLPLVLVIGALLAVAIIGGAGIGALVGGSVVIDWFKGRMNRKAGQLAAR